uniref:Putative secreted protein ovary overexpressed n=1 Tax=Rhipicephalus microplus TaxID=6941 RepID=A0A6M2D968_RHIMP
MWFIIALVNLQWTRNVYTCRTNRVPFLYRLQTAAGTRPSASLNFQTVTNLSEEKKDKQTKTLGVRTIQRINCYGTVLSKLPCRMRQCFWQNVMKYQVYCSHTP